MQKQQFEGRPRAYLNKPDRKWNNNNNNNAQNVYKYFIFYTFIWNIYVPQINISAL